MSFAAIAVVGAVAGVGTSLGGTAYQAANKPGEIDTSTMELQSRANERIAEANAIQAEKGAAYQAALIRSKNRRLMGTQRSRLMASGGAESGSVLDVMADSSAQGELDALATMYSGAQQVAAYRIQGRMGQGTAHIALQNAQQESAAIKSRWVGSLLGSAGDTMKTGSNAAVLLQ